MDKIVDLRRALHKHPELSCREFGTAQAILKFFLPLRPDKIIEKLGGNGLAFHFCGSRRGPTILLRCELDAVPVHESNSFPHRSDNHAVSHKCGHDGHMAILAAVGRELSANRPPSGKVVLLYQPAEETGEGAASVIRDARFSDTPPDFSFALHNLPGFPLGQVILRPGGFTSASRGMSCLLQGSPAHAAQPETGRSPAKAMCEIINSLSALPPNMLASGEKGFVTVVGSRLGEKTFGTAPTQAEVWATLRSESDGGMTKLVAHVEAMVEKVSAAQNLTFDISYENEFHATINSKRAVDILRRAAPPLSISEIPGPFRWSEDFGRFTEISAGALFGIGSGEELPDLHNHDYDFPDDLIQMGAEMFCRVIDECLAL